MSIQLKCKRRPICVQVKTPLISCSNTVSFSMNQESELALRSLFTLTHLLCWNSGWATDCFLGIFVLDAPAPTKCHRTCVSVRSPCVTRWPSSFSLTHFSQSQLFGSGRVATLKGSGQVAKSVASFRDYSGLKIITLKNCFLIRWLLWVSLSGILIPIFWSFRPSRNAGFLVDPWLAHRLLQSRFLSFLPHLCISGYALFLMFCFYLQAEFSGLPLGHFQRSTSLH